ncbi:MAG: hypothetical protein AAGH43_06575 [Pseudomonadota bacterium]
MEALITSGRMMDIIIALVVFEALALALLPRLAPALAARLPSLNSLWPTLLSGAILMLAIRLAVTDAPWTVLALVLFVALLAHLVDLFLRAKERAP